MQYKYGELPDYQLQDYNTKLHKDLFWLLLYKDPKTEEQFRDVDFDKYYTFLMKKINGLNSLLGYPSNMIEMCSLLEAAYLETKKSEFDYAAYRKLVLDAHALADKIGG